MKKVTDLRPCDNCSGPIAPRFYVLRASIAFIKPDAVNEFLGMHRFFGGRASDALVENFAPSSLNAVVIAGDQEPALTVEIVVCRECYFHKPLDLALLTERVNEREKRAAAAADEERHGTRVESEVGEADAAVSDREG